jgi:Uma2 family endonuclease
MRAELSRTEGRAEIIGGRIVRLPLFRIGASRIVSRIVASLWDHDEDAVVGTATLAYLVPRLPSGRESFCSCASWYKGRVPDDPMSFIEGPPTFAVEILGEQEGLERKREDYFQAGTQVVWEVDPIAKTITCYRQGAAAPVVFRQGDTADAEPAVPGWRMAVNEVFS